MSSNSSLKLKGLGLNLDVPPLSTRTRFVFFLRGRSRNGKISYSHPNYSKFKLRFSIFIIMRVATNFVFFSQQVSKPTC